MKQVTNVALLLLAFCLIGFGATPVATVTSADPFSIDGRLIKTPGVSSFPLVVRDAVSTAGSPALLFFSDGTTVKLDLNTSVKIVESEKKLTLQLLAGGLDYKFVAGSSLSIVTVTGSCWETNPGLDGGLGPRSPRAMGSEVAGPEAVSPQLSNNGQRGDRQKGATSLAEGHGRISEGVCDTRGGAASGASAKPNGPGWGFLTSPKFYIPAAGVAAGAIAAGILLTRPAASPLI